MPDASSRYASQHEFYIYFQHIATGTESKFKGFLTSFEDSFSCDWNDVSVYGRMDPISTFQGTKRQINFGFDVIAYDSDEAQENFQNSRKLIQSLYPVYEDIGPTGGPGPEFSATSIQAPPLLRIRFANLIAADHGAGLDAGLVGKLNGLSYAPDLEAGFFTGGQNGGQILPKVNRFSCNFTVFHTEGLGWDQDGTPRAAHERFPYPKTDIEGAPTGVAAFSDAAGDILDTALAAIDILAPVST